MQILYSMDVSPPSRAVLMTAQMIGLDLEVRTIDLFKKEHLTEEFIKLNPQHTIPTINDDGFVFWNSHAIMRYLINKYAEDHSLYPKDLQKRAIIDQFLHFEGEVIFTCIRNTIRWFYIKKNKTISPIILEAFEEAYNLLDKLLENRKWLAGDNCSIADLSCIASISSLQKAVPFDEYKNIVAWVETCKHEIPCYAEINEPGAKLLSDILSKSPYE